MQRPLPLFCITRMFLFCPTTVEAFGALTQGGILFLTAIRIELAVKVPQTCFCSPKQFCLERILAWEISAWHWAVSQLASPPAGQGSAQHGPTRPASPHSGERPGRAERAEPSGGFWDGGPDKPEQGAPQNPYEEWNPLDCKFSSSSLI